MQKKQIDQQLILILKEIEQTPGCTPKQLRQILGRHTQLDGRLYRKSVMLAAYRELAGTQGLQPYQESVALLLRKKPIRTLSGVAPITVLTKPFPCPGKCIFCPNDIRMPKSYLADEPGAQRAERNWFDPYLQTMTRLKALQNLGHPVDKAELIILGGTWSDYPEAYQIWFIHECLRALNDFGIKDDRAQIRNRYQQMQQTYREEGGLGFSDQPDENKLLTEKQAIHGQNLEKSYNQVVSELYVAPEMKAGFHLFQSATWDELIKQQEINETAHIRCVGLVVETRPDNISEEEVKRIRCLGGTKVQIGVQSLQDEVLTLNKRGHDVAATRRAFQLLRSAGFKIHAHWMPNLYGSTVEADKADFLKLFADPDFCPDELKIYPCSLIESAELMQQYQAGTWKPYTREELLDVLTFAITHTPEYCRLTRIIRDIPSTDIVVGNKTTNFREVADSALDDRGLVSKDIRAREVRKETLDPGSLRLSELEYESSIGREVFLQWTGTTTSDAKEEKLAGFLRLCLPSKTFIDELADCAIIREVHVYGQAVPIGDAKNEHTQHFGLGKKLIEKARQLAKEAGYRKIAVISAIGTREYYRKQGFEDGEMYQLANIFAR